MPHAKILIVHHEAELVRAVTLSFESAGYDVVHTAGGPDATRTAVREQPDVIVLGRPSGEGSDLAERLRKDPRSMSIPVIGLDEVAPSIETDGPDRAVEPQTLLDRVGAVLAGTPSD